MSTFSNTQPKTGWTSETFTNLQTHTSWTTTIVISLLGALIVHVILTFIDYPILSIAELLWNTFVWLMPARIVYSLRPGLNPSSTDENQDGSSEKSTEHAAKSEVLRDVFGVKGGSRMPRPKTSSTAPAGLGNWDNSCYQNSVLQSLASIRSLKDFYDQLERRNISLPGETMIATLQNVIADLNAESNQGHRIWTPPKLKSMSSWQQQDAQEYFSKIMDELEKDTLGALRRMGREETSAGDASLSLSLTGMDEEETSEAFTRLLKPGQAHTGSSNPLAELANPLEGLLAQRVGCTQCGYVEGLSLIPFNCLTLPLGRHWSYDLNDCLDEHTNLEVIEGVECAKCTLLQARHQLRRQTEDLATASDDSNSPPTEEIEKYQQELQDRLGAVTEALQDEDFTDSTLRDKCKISSRQKVSSNKTKQAMIMRTPKCLALHVNRSMFDESTGDQLKNFADVSYKGSFDISPWCVGRQIKLNVGKDIIPTEEWEMDPTKSMATASDHLQRIPDRQYRLSAIITHYGRHENGHYICYRKLPPAVSPNSDLQGDAKDDTVEDRSPADHEQWWRLSDEDVSAVSEEEALSQGGVFMLFYERVDEAGVRKREKANVLAEVMEVREAASTKHQEQPTPVKDENDAALESLTLTDPEESKAVAKVDKEDLSMENILPGNSEKPTTEPPTEPEDQVEPEKMPSTQIPTSHPQKRVSPETMRTAGIRNRSSEDLDPFKGAPMMATT